MKTQISALFALSLVSVFAFGGDPTTKPAAAYPLTKCVISDEALPAEGTVIESIDGREVRFCCADCVAVFKKDTEASHKLMDKKIIEASKATYPLKECVVSGEALGGMGETVMHVYRPTNQLVEFCCASCTKQFEKNPAPYLAKLSKASK
jgi:YHS domain-containing protein